MTTLLQQAFAEAAKLSKAEQDLPQPRQHPDLCFGCPHQHERQQYAGHCRRQELLRCGELDGRWPNGSWTDDNSGHEDVLRGRFRETKDGNYRVIFTGRFAKVIPFRFSTTLNVVGRDGDKILMAGKSRIMGFV